MTPTTTPLHDIGEAPDPIRDALAGVVERHRADRSGDVAA